MNKSTLVRRAQRGFALAEMLLAVAKAPKKRRPTKPSKASKQRRLDSKKRDSNKKQSRRGWSE